MITNGELFSGLGELQDFASDALAAYQDKFANLQADEVAAADALDIVGLVVPEAAAAARLLRLFAALTPSLTEISGGSGADLGPSEGGKIGAGR